MSVLRGPADADHFRVKEGRFGQRFYTDQLPACPLGEYLPDWRGPSISTLKPPFANKYVPMRSIADMPDADWKRLADLPADTRYEAIKSHEKLSGRINMDRGTIVHEWAEDLLFGRPMRMVLGYSGEAEAQAERYRKALVQFFDDHQPTLIAAEVVCLHRTLNGVGYGGTCDAMVSIGGANYIIDWKSRSSDHGAYLEEAAQIAGYANAEYMIVEDDGGPARAAIPELAGGLVVSIKDDGYRVYPVDLVGAGDVFVGMHGWWADQRTFTASKSIGAPWAPATSKATPQAVAEQFAAPDEGADADPRALDALKAHYGDLSDTARQWIGDITAGAQRKGVSFHMKERQTVRRFEILRGLVILAGGDDVDDDTVRILVSTAMDSDAPQFPTVEVGHAVGALDASTAAAFAALCDQLVHGAPQITYSDDGYGRVAA